MRNFLLVLALGAALAHLSTPAAASDPSVFDALTGVFGSVLPGDANCDTNPRFQSFSPDRRRILFHWAAPHKSSYLGRMITDNAGDVVAFDASSVTQTRDQETDFDSQGKPVLWTYHVSADGAGFCASPSDWLGPDCVVHYVRCTASVPTS